MTADTRTVLAATLTLPWPPSLNRMVRRSGTRVHVSQAAHDYKDTAGWRARAQGVRAAVAGNLRVTVHLYRPTRTGDIDNYLKVVFDSMTGVLWVDDAQVVELHVYRHDDKDCPRVELQVEEIA